MILIFGGTTEGRVAAEVCDRASKSYLYATKGADQRLLSNYAEQICGALGSDQIREIVEQRGVDLIIDAAHPFASVLHSNITDAARMVGVPTIRFERAESCVEYENSYLFDTLADAIEHIKTKEINGVLALTGVKSAVELSAIARSHRVILRIMDREESHSVVCDTAFPSENLIFYDIFSEDNYNQERYSELNIGAILTKESGLSGGFDQKIELAKSLNTPLLIIRRPKLPIYLATIYGEYGLRREIERLLPNYYELRTGFTTGSAATAAAISALNILLCGEVAKEIEIILPNGEPFKIPIERGRLCGDFAEATVIKDGGDDPDATDKLAITATVKFTDSDGDVVIKGGEGVGRVTLPGIGIEVGEAAINPVPQQMIRSNISRFAADRGVEVEIFVPNGAEVATKTFNPRLGIVDGISILGTSGIVQPYSATAFLESIARQIDVAKAMGSDVVIINSGAMSERYIKRLHPDYLPQSYIHYGNLIGATIELAANADVSRVVLGIMIGKAVKLAAGALDTHSGKVVLNVEYLLSIARKANMPNEIIAQIATITTARQLWTIIPASQYRFFDLIKEACYHHCKALIPNGELEVLLISEDGAIF